MSSKAESKSTLPERRPTQCHYIVPRKKRYCRMTIKPGRKFCPEHERFEEDLPNKISQDTGEIDNRVPCPLDPKHTCYASKLEKHLKVCNARCDVVPPYISKGVNSVTAADAPARACLKDVPLDRLRTAVEMVERLYNELVSASIEHRIECSDSPVHPTVASDHSEEHRAHSSRRHLRQTSSLLRALDRELLVAPHTCFVELGAGKGHVSYYLARAVQNIPACSVLLVDRASHRHKQDNKLDPDQHSVSRLRADINDLLLERVEQVERSRAVVAVSKHLCGVATDYALRCVTARGVIDKTRGVVMATCCHHQCTMAGYVANEFLEENGINKEYFDIIMGIVSWGTCGTGYSRDRSEDVNDRKRKKMNDESFNINGHNVDSEELNKVNSKDTNKIDDDKYLTNETAVCSEDSMIIGKGKLKDDNEINSVIKVGTEIVNKDKGSETERIKSNASFEEENVKKDMTELATNIQTEKANITTEINNKIENNTMGRDTEVTRKRMTSVQALGLTVERRTEIGRHAKALIDYGRVMYLRKCGFDAKLCYYVEVDVSPENVCIIAKKKVSC